MFPFLVIVIGIAVLLFGKRLAVLGAAVGALLGASLLRLLPGSGSPMLELIIVILLAVIGFFVAGFAKGIVDLVLLVLGALGGAAIALGFLNVFGINTGLLDWVLVVLGGVIGIILVKKFKDWAMLILAGLIGGLLVTRGLTIWLPSLEGALASLMVIVLAGGSIIYQGGFLNKGKASK
jgi:hypothetical protein